MLSLKMLARIAPAWFSWGLLAPRQHPAGPDEMAGVAAWVVLEVVLMLGLGLPEVAGRRQFGHHLARPQAGGIHVGDGVLGHLLLLAAGMEDGRAIARAAVVALAVRGARIVDLEEELQQPAVADSLRIEDDFDRLGMGAVVAVGRVGHVAAGIAHAGGDDAGLRANQFLHAPEATAGENGSFVGGVHAMGSLCELSNSLR